jgi:hemerythrin
MRLFKWGHEDAVFVPELDAEHRNLFHLGADLQKAIEGGAPAERIGEALQGLLAAALDHFAHEERLMKSTRYPSLAWHKGQHDTVRKRAKALARRFAEGDRGAAQELLEFMSHWLKDHCSLSDRMMASYLRNYHLAVTRNVRPTPNWLSMPKSRAS